MYLLLKSRIKPFRSSFYKNVRNRQPRRSWDFATNVNFYCQFDLNCRSLKAKSPNSKFLFLHLRRCSMRIFISNLDYNALLQTSASELYPEINSWMPRIVIKQNLYYIVQVQSNLQTYRHHLMHVSCERWSESITWFSHNWNSHFTRCPKYLHLAQNQKSGLHCNGKLFRFLDPSPNVQFIQTWN